MPAREAGGKGLVKRKRKTCFEEPTDRMTAVASIAAAVAANCPPLFEQHVQAGRAFGIGDADIRLVLRVCQMIRGKAAEKMDAAATGISGAATAQTAVNAVAALETVPVPDCEKAMKVLAILACFAAPAGRIAHRELRSGMFPAFKSAPPVSLVAPALTSSAN